VCDIGEEWVEKIRYDQTYEAAFPGGKASRIDIGKMVHLLSPLENTLTCRLADTGLVAETLGDGHQRDTKVCCNVFHPDRHFSRHD
jgi:hypothetical protein